MAKESWERPRPPEFGSRSYQHMLAAARQISQKTVGRLHLLQHQFPDSLPKEVMEWLQTYEDNPRRDRRLAPRFCHKHTRIELSETYPPTQGVHGWLWDYSPRGVGMVMPRPVKIGSLVYVRSDETPDAAWVQVEVRRCEPHADGWAVGGVLFEPSPEQLARLVC